MCHEYNKANLRDLIAVTGLVILLKIVSKLSIFWPLINNRAHLLYYIKLCASFQSHQWIQTGVTVWKCSIWSKISDFFVLCDLKMWWMTLENNRAPLLCYFKLVHHFMAICEFKLELQSGNAQFGSKSMIFFSCVTLKKQLGHLS